jgi:hypothetical protein
MGIYWPRSKSFEFDDDGNVAPGAKIYFFDAGTSTPKPAYTTAELSTTHTHPVVADGNGRWPAVFLDFGAYKETATTSADTTLWTVDDIPNAEPTDPGDGVDADSIFQTGDMIFVGKNGIRSGFVRCNQRSIGSAASAATERANADCADLFAYLWNNYANGQCPVSGGRGATAAADFAANKTILTPDCRSIVLGGFDDMGNTATLGYASAPVFSGSGILPGSILGGPTHTILEAQVPAHTHSFSATSSGSGAHTHTGTTGDQSQVHTHSGTTATESATHSHTYDKATSGATFGVAGGGGANALVGALTQTATSSGSESATHTHTITTGSESVNHTHSFSTTSDPGNHTHTVSGTSGSYGSGAAHNIMQQTMPVTVLMKL